jgi:hypothetical protein
VVDGDENGLPPILYDRDEVVSVFLEHNGSRRESFFNSIDIDFGAKRRGGDPHCLRGDRRFCNVLAASHDDA